ncbi:hypothetical protein QVD17_15292 [Tagetes erecta]|uniref:Uncharacterized protein n=1 Tax=Tagetes erecta TaxID=13708 RepID=A0AAD8NZJ5_TARER|nr:hypothetical protein QVD17_15292 [Tagetes erecta]
MVLHLFFTVASSAAPLIPFIPPVRNFTVFVASMEDLWRDSILYTIRMYPSLRYASSRLFDCMLCNSAH